MCGDADPHKAAEVLKDAFNAGIMQVTEIHRGEGLVG
jgi:S-adenosylmethionine/arginine decarboxylase-like enzyme